MSEVTHPNRGAGFLTEAVKLRYPSCDVKQFATLAGICAADCTVALRVGRARTSAHAHGGQ